MTPRVLLLTTPLDERTHLDGARLAAIDLARGLLAIDAARPVMLARRGYEAPIGCEAIVVEGVASVLAAIVRARVDVVHALFAPRRRTALVLSALRRATRVVQTIASRPRKFGRFVIGGDVVVATSEWCAGELAKIGRPADAVIPMPFVPPRAIPELDVPRDLLLYVGDAEDGLELVFDAMKQVASPLGVKPILGVATRDKGGRRVSLPPSLADRAFLVGEQPSLLPWIAAARCVLLPARDSFAKLDHPRALLEAIALGTRIVVGSAPSLRELVVDDSMGEIATDASSVREAMENAFSIEKTSAKSIARVLLPRGANVVAAAYAELYPRVSHARKT